jgi:chromosome segregation ATPase
MADAPDNAAEWRGHISAKVDEYGRRLKDHDTDVRELRAGASATTVELARLSTSVEGLRGDIKKALEDQAEQRRDEFVELQKAMENNKMTSKEKVTYIFVPLIVASILALITLISTKTI